VRLLYGAVRHGAYRTDRQRTVRCDAGRCGCGAVRYGHCTEWCGYAFTVRRGSVRARYGTVRYGYDAVWSWHGGVRCGHGTVRNGTVSIRYGKVRLVSVRFDHGGARKARYNKSTLWTDTVGHGTLHSLQCGVISVRCSAVTAMVRYAYDTGRCGKVWRVGVVVHSDSTGMRIIEGSV
jgi:hypothetical protein